MVRQILSAMMMLIVAILVISGCGDDDSDSIERITVDELKDLLDSQADVMVIDVRSETTYASGHIPGAISMTYPEEIQARYQELPTDKLLIFY